MQFALYLHTLERLILNLIHIITAFCAWNNSNFLKYPLPLAFNDKENKNIAKNAENFTYRASSLKIIECGTFWCMNHRTRKIAMSWCSVYTTNIIMKQGGILRLHKIISDEWGKSSSMFSIEKWQGMENEHFGWDFPKKKKFLTR